METEKVNILQKIKEICDGIEYTRHIPKEAEELAKQNNIVVIVGGSDDLMYCYGADCYMTYCCEHGYGWDGNTLKNISDKQLEKEANQLGLKIWWCGKIEKEGLVREGYSVDKKGAFSYTVNDKIEYLDFKVLESKKESDVYCTGIIIKLPDDFVSCKEGEFMKTKTELLIKSLDRDFFALKEVLQLQKISFLEGKGEVDKMNELIKMFKSDYVLSDDDWLC